MIPKQDSAVNFFEVEAENFKKCPKPHHVEERIGGRDTLCTDAKLNQVLQSATKKRETLLKARKEKLRTRFDQLQQLAETQRNRKMELQREKKEQLLAKLGNADEHREEFIDRVKDTARKMGEPGPATMPSAPSTATLTADRSPLDMGRQDIQDRIDAASLRRKMQQRSGKKQRFVGVKPPAKRYRPDVAAGNGKFVDESDRVPDFSKSKSIPLD